MLHFKAPTCVLIEPDGDTFSAFGYDAESKYNSLVKAEEHDKWFFFRRLDETVQYGGTVDIAVQEVAENGSMKNIYKASGGDWGGAKVDEAFVSVQGDKFKVNMSVVTFLFKTQSFSFREAQVEKCYTAPTSSQTSVSISILYTLDPNPMYTTDQGCHLADTLNVAIGGSGLGRAVKVRMIYGAPTCVLIEPDGDTFSAFGYDAESKYNSLVEAGEHDKWFFFRRFKMKLYNTDIKRDMDIEDETGKTLNAKLAGISSVKLTIALEPEAAAIYCRFLAAERSDNEDSLSTFKPGSKVVVVDAGGKESIDEFKRSNMEDYLYMIRDFEVKKRNVDPLKGDKPVVFRISATLPKLVKKIKGKKIPEVIIDSLFGSTVSVQGDKLKVDMSVVTFLFKTQSLIFGEAQVEQYYLTTASSQTILPFPIFYTLDPNPTYTTAEGCHLAGTLNVAIGGSGLGREVEVRMIYGGTEIEVEATEVATGNVKRMKIDFLS
ncbi:hypothetical protein MAR_032373 [Mya arenaria]|uniref:Agglutinin domain-containing protein n=1 Tax=Mya arenaria TaxID=6604 RepID=A0ABY7FAF5_MYAAR|nr:hypothetical protein MAR_032373 [Mya arenaria]